MRANYDLRAAFGAIVATFFILINYHGQRRRDTSRTAFVDLRLCVTGYVDREAIGVRRLDFKLVQERIFVRERETAATAVCLH